MRGFNAFSCGVLFVVTYLCIPPVMDTFLDDVSTGGFNVLAAGLAGCVSHHC